MRKIIYVGMFSLMAFAIANSGIRYERLSELKGVTPGNQKLDVESEQAKLLKRFDSLRHKSLLLDGSVDTNEKLRYLTHSDNFEEALFLIEYLQGRFNEFGPHNDNEASMVDIEFYLERLAANLDVVEKELGYYNEE
tara:strand:+ start:204 stop:614 length:411 start_codon:yes stop_codon:yes gene_type:complete